MATAMQETSREELREQIKDLDSKFKVACNQLRLLNDYISRTQRRYDRADINGNRCFRYSLRIKLCNIERTRNMFYEYALRSAHQLDSMRERLGYIINYSRVEEDSEDEESIVDGIAGMSIGGQ